MTEKNMLPPTFIMRPRDRTMVFINGASLHHAARNLDAEIDFHALADLFEANCDLRRAFFYAATVDTDDYSPVRPLIDWLFYNGYTVINKTAREFTNQAGQRRVKGNVNVDMAVDMVRMAPKLDHLILISGDNDMSRAVQVVQDMGVRVTTISTMKSNPPMLGDELRRQTDNFVELKDILPVVGRRG